jgi:FK506-binding nuclear protein
MVPPVYRARKTAFANGFEVHQVTQGSNPNGPIAQPGKRLTVKYIGTLQSNGKVFDRTKPGKTFSFRLGAFFTHQL